MEEIKKLGVLSVGKISALFGVLLGLIVGGALWGWFSYLRRIPSEVLMQMGIVEIPVYGFGQFLLSIAQLTISSVVWGVLIALIYNLFAKFVGGITIETKRKRLQKRKNKFIFFYFNFLVDFNFLISREFSGNIFQHFFLNFFFIPNPRLVT